MHNLYKTLCDTPNPYSIRIENRITGQSFGIDDLEDKGFQIKPNHHYSVICNSDKISYLGKDLKAILEPLLTDNKQLEAEDVCKTTSNVKISPLSADIYVINLDRAPERWKHMQKQLDHTHLNYQRFAAIDGYKVVLEDRNTGNSFLGSDLKDLRQKLAAQDTSYKVICNPEDSNPVFFMHHGRGIAPKNEKGRFLTAGELGVWCSHYLIWKKMVDNHIPQTIILEDDIKINSKNFAKDIKDFTKSLPNNFDVSLIDYGWGTKPFSKKNGEISHIPFHTTKQMWYGLWAYIISFEGAQKLLSYDIYNKQVDMFLQQHVLDGSINGYFSNIALVGLDDISKDSSIDAMGRYW